MNYIWKKLNGRIWWSCQTWTVLTFRFLLPLSFITCQIWKLYLKMSNQIWAFLVYLWLHPAMRELAGDQIDFSRTIYLLHLVGLMVPINISSKINIHFWYFRLWDPAPVWVSSWQASPLGSILARWHYPNDDLSLLSPYNVPLLSLHLSKQVADAWPPV